MFNKKNNNKGFTLVELLVVIAIIGILAVVAVPSLFKNIEKGKIADLEADISAIRSAALSYYAEKSEYPVDTNSSNTTQGKNDLLKANDKLENELEGLSNPFKANEYTLSGTAPGLLQLTIKLPSSSQISEDGFLKLQKDLGISVVPFNKEGSPAQGEPGNAGYKPATDASYDPKEPITINLINN